MSGTQPGIQRVAHGERAECRLRWVRLPRPNGPAWLSDWPSLNMPHERTLSELSLSKLWADRGLPSDLRLTDGRRLHIVYPGVWSNSNGPDFSDALLEIGGRLVRGAVEIHLLASDWRRHAHSTNESYSEVVLHVVGTDDLDDSIAAIDGTPVPTLEIGDYAPDLGLLGAGHLPKLFANLGTGPCLPTLAREYPRLIRQVLQQQGWSRLVDKQLRVAQALTVLTASEVLYSGILDALGYSANRGGMEALAEAVPLTLVEALFDQGYPASPAAILLGTAGFLPLEPALQQASGMSTELAGTLESEYRVFRDEYRIPTVNSSLWSLNRVRPSNHPGVRLLSLASLITLARPDGLLNTFLALPLDRGRAWDDWLSRSTPAIGESRRRQVMANVLAPYMAAYADVMRDEELAEEVADLWDCLPGAVDDQITRAARRQIVGDARFPIRLAVEEQGLHQISRNGCKQLRCFECPIAALAVRHENWDLRVADSLQR